MSVSELLAELGRRGVDLRADGMELRVSAPKGALTRELTAKMRSHKAELLALLSEVSGDRERCVGAAASQIPLALRGEVLPLSLSQQRLWFMDSLTPGTAFLNLPCAFKIHGPLDLTVLEGTLASLAARHETLRTRFELGPEGPAQVVVPTVPVQLAVIDLSSEPGVETSESWVPLLKQKLAEPLPVSGVPMFRAGVLRLSSELHVFHFVTSHLVWDGWSFDVFVRELRATYRALACGEAPPPPPPIQYGDYVLWHRRWLEEPAQKASLEYWKGKLAGLPASLELPFDHPRPAHMSYRGTTLPFALPEDTTRRLRALARERGATLYMVLLAALEVLLRRYTGQDDLVVGSPVDGRVRPETEGILGLFVNTLVLRTRVDPKGSFVDLLDRVRETCIEAYDHQHTPFEQLVEILKPPRDRSRTPLFQVMFSYQQIRGREGDMGPVRLEQFHVHAGNAGTDVTYWVKDDGTRVYGAFEYAIDLFERETVRRMSEAMLDVLSSVAADPHRVLSELPLSRREEQELDEWNRTDAAYSQTLVHRSFEERVHETPFRDAVVFEGRSVSYAELLDRSRRVARCLVGLGVRRGDHVAVCMPRSIDLIATLLGVLEAGAAYVPLDPSYPPSRLSMALEDSRARVLVVAPESRAVLTTAVDVLCVEEGVLAGVSGEPLVIEGEASSDAAYVIYTSGSTGRPKGVAIEHRNVAAFLRGMEDVLTFDTPGVWLAGTSVAFDISVLELFGALTHGFTVVLLGEQRLGATVSEDHSLGRLLERHGVTHFQCTPSQAALLLLDPLARRSLPRLRQLLIGGEALSASLASELLAALGPATLHNMYGPTETTVWSVTHEVRDGDRVVPIGRPIANTRCYVLDADGRRVPVGAVGELFLGGDGVARGYHEREELTAERFLPDPFREPGHRMYRTGDLVRWDGRGLLEYRGRTDFQVKVRGHRIELGEIEAALEGHASVSAAVVVARPDPTGTPRLVAYVVPAEGESCFAEALRAHLKERLPAIMIPAAFVELPAFPMTPNGKVDRKALPEPEPGSAAAATRVAPRDEVEKRIASIWGEALGLSDVGIDDDFFDLGGHSLLGVKILTQMFHVYDLRLGLAVLFEAPTVRTLAELVRNELAGPDPASVTVLTPSWTPIVPIQTSGTLPPFFCAAGKGGNPMNLRYLAAALGPDQPFFGLQHRGVDGRHRPHESVTDMAREFAEHIRLMQPEGPYYVGGFSGGGIAAYELAQQLRAGGSEVALLVLLESVNPQMPARTLAERVRFHVDRLGDQGPRYLGRAVRARVSRALDARRTQQRANLAQVDPFEYRYEAVTAAWVAASERYVPSRYEGRVALFRSRVRDTAVLDPRNGWGDLLSGDLEIFEVDGGHVSFVDAEHAPATGRALARALWAAGSAPDSLRDPGTERSGVWTLAG